MAASPGLVLRNARLGNHVSIEASNTIRTLSVLSRCPQDQTSGSKTCKEFIEGAPEKLRSVVVAKGLARSLTVQAPCIRSVSRLLNERGAPPPCELLKASWATKVRAMADHLEIEWTEMTWNPVTGQPKSARDCSTATPREWRPGCTRWAPNATVTASSLRSIHDLVDLPEKMEEAEGRIRELDERPLP